MSISFTGLSCVKGSMAKTNRQILVTAPSFRKGESTLKSYDRHPWGPYFFETPGGILSSVAFLLNYLFPCSHQMPCYPLLHGIRDLNSNKN